MTKEVLISISGLHMGAVQDNAAGDEPIEVLVPGFYYWKRGKHYLFFEENIEGYQEVVKSQLNWRDEGRFEVQKKGLVNMHMVYEKGQKTQCFYDTPLGRLELGIFTTEIEIVETEDDIQIRVDYSMEANHQYIGECKIFVHVKPQGAENFSLF